MRISLGIFILLHSCIALFGTGPVPVTITREADRYQLYRAGEPFFVKGVGGTQNLKLLRDSGANTIRTWTARQLEGIVDDVADHDLAAVAGLWIEHERHGFDYDDEDAVARQLEELKARVDRLKDHPALLIWGVGNEVELSYSNPKVWDTVEALAAYIKSVDPHHPVMTVIAYPDRDKISHILERCPSLDLIGVNAYGGIHALPRVLTELGWEKPYLVTEWGPTGFWESGSTPWGAELEATSTQKAAAIKQRYRYITDDPRCLGSFVFLWGQKQERTPTWFGMFLEDGSQTEAVDVMQELWTGKPPEIKAPQISPLFLNGFLQQDFKGLRYRPGEKILVHFQRYRGNPEALEVHWELLPESTDKKWGGDREQRPPSLPFEYRERDFETIQFQAPQEPGPYRLFVTVTGPQNKAATANIPFLVLNPPYRQSSQDLLIGQVMAVAYSGFRAGQHPDRGVGAVNPTREEILEDLSILQDQGFRLIRVYDSRENSRMVLELIKEHQLPIQVLLGIWLDAEISSHETCAWLTEPIPDEVLAANREKNRREVQRGIQLARAFPEIVMGVSVGNESQVDWNDHQVPLDDHIDYVRQVKAAVEQPVTVAENYLWWAREGAPLARELDFVGVHTYPIWEGKTIEEALSFTRANIQQVHEALPGSQIAVLEAGWPTTSNEFPNQASEGNQERYYRELKDWAESTNTTVFFFEAFDEPWKGDPDNPLGAEKHWGLYFEDRTPKAGKRPREEPNPEKASPPGYP